MFRYYKHLLPLALMHVTVSLACTNIKSGSHLSPALFRLSGYLGQVVLTLCTEPRHQSALVW